MGKLNNLLFTAALLSMGMMQPTEAAEKADVKWDATSLIVNGKRVTPVMGEFHYSRTPANEWDAELKKMKEGGVTMVATYVFWNHVEEEEGVFDWSGQRSLRGFLEACKANDMPVVLRMGPFCHGEVRNGGIPDWMFTKGCKLREANPTFLSYVTRLYRQIFTQVQGLQWKDGGPVVACQFDNEYRGRGEYLMKLKEIANEIGFSLPFYTRTGWPELATPVPYGSMLPLYGDYPDGHWDQGITDCVGKYYEAFNFKEFRSSSNIGTDMLGAQNGQKTENAYPYFTCELGGGMSMAYHRRPYILPEDIYSIALVKLGSGSNLLGYYMYHGGSNPDGKLNTLNEVLTSPGTHNNDLAIVNYDYQAPLGQFGQKHPHFYLLRKLHLFMHDYGEMLAPMKANFVKVKDANGQLVTPEAKLGDDSYLRWSYRSDGKSAFVFINNYERLQNITAKKGVQFDVNGVKFPQKAMTIPAATSCIFPVNVDGIKYATAQIIARRDGKIYMEQINGIPTEIALNNGKVMKNVKAKGLKAPVTGNIYLLSPYEAGHLFLEAEKEQKITNVEFTKTKEAGTLHEIKMLGTKRKIAHAPSQEDYADAAVYTINVPAGSKGLLDIDYHGDCCQLYANGRLIQDDFYNGRHVQYGLWRLPEGTTSLELRIMPLQANEPVYIPRQGDKTPGEKLNAVMVIE